MSPTAYGIGLALALLAAAIFGAIVLLFLVWAFREVRAALEARSQLLQTVAVSLDLPLLDRLAPDEAIGASRSSVERDLHDPGGRHRFLQDRGYQLVSEVLRGEREGVRVTLCRHTYDGNLDDSPEQTMAAFVASDLALPAFALARADTATRIWFTLTGMKHVHLPGTSDADPRYFLRGPDEDAIRRLFTPALVELLLERELWNVEGRGPHLIVFRDNHVIAPEELPSFLAQALEVLGAFRASATQRP